MGQWTNCAKANNKYITYQFTADAIINHRVHPTVKTILSRSPDMLTSLRFTREGEKSLKRILLINSTWKRASWTYGVLSKYDCYILSPVDEYFGLRCVT